VFPGYSGHVLAARAGWVKLVVGIAEGPWPVGPEKKAFSPKDDLPKLASYKGKANKEFWAGLPTRKVAQAPGLVDYSALVHARERWGCSDKDRFETVCADLLRGADIGCKGAFRAGSVSRNARAVTSSGTE
jgi:hypothetical protein